MNDRFQRIRHSQRARQAIPNLLTLGNLVSGALALGVILNEGPMWQAFALIFVALLCDLFDGRAARALGTDGGHLKACVNRSFVLGSVLR